MMFRNFIATMLGAFLLSSAVAYACTDFSGYFIRGNFSISMTQYGCEAIDITYTTSGSAGMTDHIEIGKVNRRPFVAIPNFSEVEHGWTFDSDQLINSTRYFDAAGKVIKTEMTSFSLDRGKNLVEDFTFSFLKGQESLPQTTFKRVGN